MQYLIHPSNRVFAKITCGVKYSQFTSIKDNLSCNQLTKFSKSCFGRFLSILQFTIKHQLIHGLLLKELAQPNKHEIWVGIDGMKLCFGLKECALVTGLSFFGSIDKMKYELKKWD